MVITQFGWLVPVLPLTAFLLISGVTKKFRLLSSAIAIGFALLSFGLSVLILLDKLHSPVVTEYFCDWLTITSGQQTVLSIQLGYLIDPLAALMCVIVTFIASLVLIYSNGYMQEDRGFSRFFAYVSLFTFAMLGLVLSNNYFQTFMFWELVGLCSYLLIGFWYHKPSAAEACKKAFITNRWADFGFLIGIIGLFTVFGTFNFQQLSLMIGQQDPQLFLIGIALLVLVGPLGKSAQFPFHVWLPDAMEGPTPVSALIHAATMVAAGIYLVARGFVLFASFDTVLQIMAYLGGFTALFAASIALVQCDIKRILAYSTVSQLGLMMMALGMGGMSTGMFHLTTHAVFKALLFLGAGSIIHAVHEQDITKMGGLHKHMPISSWTFVIGALALAGIFPLAGFWSKDEILTLAYHHHYRVLFVVTLLVAYLTAFYIFRLVFIAIFGQCKLAKAVHESPRTMTYPLLILAGLSCLVGLLNTPWFYQSFGFSFGTFIFWGEPEVPHINWFLAVLSTLIAGAGISSAWLVYRVWGNRGWGLLGRLLLPVNNLLVNKYYVDELFAWVYRRIILAFGWLFDLCDRKVFDGLFDGCALIVFRGGVSLKHIQTGRLQQYALIIFAGLAVLILLGGHL